MDLQLAGKKVAITGASRGICRAVAEAFAAEGADVALCARGEAGVREAAASLAARGVRAFGDCVDLHDRAAYEAWVGSAAEKLGGLDVFVHGVTSMAMDVRSEATWRDQFELNVLGAVIGCQAAVPFLKQSGAGAIVLISSGITRVTGFSENEIAYGSAKAGLTHFGAQLAQVLAPEGIRVNVVSPGSIEFEGGLWDQVRRTQPAFYEQVRSMCPLGRLGRPEEVASVAVFAASPCASLLVGSNLHVNGGQLKTPIY
ncbi:MAG: SDR family oxidoreductase [Deltaproteobacteria bacterium]|nr:SDR family oxidoreductase [Deltaproteobacteria bacterium]